MKLAFEQQQPQLKEMIFGFHYWLLSTLICKIVKTKKSLIHAFGTQPNNL